MKTMKSIFAISLALIFSLGISNVIVAHELKTNDQPHEVAAKMVNYVVRVENAGAIKNIGRNFLILMTDANGRLVAPAQTFRTGVSDYNFFEGGTVRGTRVARMIQVPLASHSFMVMPVSKTGIFYGGCSYLFILKPIPVEQDAGQSTH
jgi:hypothetical protein